MVSFRPRIVRSLRLSTFTRTHFSSLLSSSHHQSGRREGFIWIGTRGRYTSSAEFAHDELQDDARAIEKDTALRLALSWVVDDYCKESMLSLHVYP
ncbi:DNA repair protein recA homolog 2, mitochondrial-like isoform X2 [Actinidia eriantha]|uniref:DNA repair protein recA homolog 2, mitochondrial-like isoform X2 n=1 Tax=Actinidia eriantha TaxID=165200 RepID=UPI00258A635F|nr:DNA repair protein recA homolog 2, mitochondrial-like isoform X2 [Actinidia eriantha]